MQSLPGFTRQKAYRKRASGRARLTFPGGFAVAVSMYSLVQPATKGSPVFLNAVNNEPLKVESAFIDQDTGEAHSNTLHAHVSGKGSGNPPCQGPALLRHDGRLHVVDLWARAYRGHRNFRSWSIVVGQPCLHDASMCETLLLQARC